VSGAPMTPMPKPNTALAMAFLDILDKGGRHDLFFAHPTLPRGAPGKTGAATFFPEDRDKLKARIDSEQGKRNIYVSFNRGRGRQSLNHKLSKFDIDCIRWIACDLDPTKLEGVDLATATAHFLAERAAHS
jgi:hypothetical protein